jgi:hypothetical protein
MRPPPCFDDRETRNKLESLCSTNKIDTQLLIDLCEVVYGYSGSGRKEGVTAEISQCIDNFVSRSNRNSR